MSGLTTDGRTYTSDIIFNFSISEFTNVTLLNANLLYFNMTNRRLNKWNFITFQNYLEYSFICTNIVPLTQIIV